MKDDRASTGEAPLDQLVRQFAELKRALKEENAFLRQRLAMIEGQWDHLTSDPVGHARHARRTRSSEVPAPILVKTETPVTDEADIGRSLTRRHALQMFGAAAAGGVGLAVGSTILSAEPAAAANGGTVFLGEGNAAADSTQVETTVAYGLIGSSTDGSGGGVYGIDGASAGGAYGVRGTSINGLGVYSTLTGNGLGAIAGEDQSGQTSSYGVYGSSGSGTGIYGVSTNGTAVYGQAAGASGLRAGLFHKLSGVMGDNNNGEAGVTGLSAGGTLAWGVHGVAGSNSGSIPGGPAGVYGESGDTDGVGVYGNSVKSSGVVGATSSESSAGVHGVGVSLTGSPPPAGPVGVQGDSGEENGYGVYGACYDGAAGVAGFSRGTGLGVSGVSTSGVGAQFSGGSAPLCLVPAAVTGPPTSGTHAQGELYVDSNGALYLCTAAGTSGTWQQVVTEPVTASTPPTVTSSTPASGPTSGGTTVTIIGTNFTGATAVTFGAAGAAKSFTVVSSTKITAVTAAASAGEHYVTVTTPAGTSPDNASVVFTYVGAPTVTSSTPTSGPTTGGTTVTITGTNFTGATAVTFGAAGAAKSFTVVSSTKITAVTEAASAGEHYVTVTTPAGTSPDNASVVFTYS
jgi:hypothetical protein